MENPQDWLTGTNQRTGLTGLFPGTFVSFMEVMGGAKKEALPPAVPPRPPNKQHNDSGFVSPGSELLALLLFISHLYFNILY